MPLLTLRDVVAGFGGPPLLDGVSVAIDDGERVALVGRNGMGKTTLLRLIAGDMQHDSGEIQRLPDLRVASLVQIVPPEMSGTVFENVALGLDGIGERVSTHHRLTVAGDLDEIEAIELEAAEQSIQAADAWPLFQKVEAVISRLDLPADERVGPLSAGLRRRVLLGRALVRDPQLAREVAERRRARLDGVRTGLEAEAVLLEAADQAAGARARLEHLDVRTGSRQVVSAGQAGGAGSEHQHVGHQRVFEKVPSPRSPLAARAA